MSGPMFERARDRRDGYEAVWRSTIAEGVARGELLPLDPQLAAVAWLSLGNWVHQWYRSTGPLLAADIAALFSATLLHGMSAAAKANETENQI